MDDKPFGQVLYEIERGIRPSYRDNVTADEGSNYKGRYPQRHFTGQRFGYGTKPAYGQSFAGGRSASTSRFSSEGHFAPSTEGGPLFYRQQFSGASQQDRQYRAPYTQKREYSLTDSVKQDFLAQKEPEEGLGVATGEKKTLRKLLVINGPNLNFLGIREKGIYGAQDYNYLLNMIAQKGLDCHAAISVFQSNHEGAIIDKIQEAYFDKTEGIIINPGAYTHYSYAIRDALASITVPKVEIHISNIMEREDFRKVSVTAPVCDKQIYGHGLNGYLEAIDFVLEKLEEQD